MALSFTAPAVSSKIVLALLQILFIDFMMMQARKQSQPIKSWINLIKIFNKTYPALLTFKFLHYNQGFKKNRIIFIKISLDL